MRVSILVVATLFSSAAADDWPQWNGPLSTGEIVDKDILKVIPKSGLKKLWSQPVQLGYSGPAVADGRVYVTDFVRDSGRITNNPGTRDQLNGKERVLCFDVTSGQQVWVHEEERKYALSYPGGPRVVPTIVKGMVYTIGAEGDLLCLNAESGDVVWKRNYAKDYQANTPIWGHAASPLVYKNQLICLVGGSGSLVVSFDLKTGKENWKALTEKETGYCPPSMIQAGGVDQLLIWSTEDLYSLNPDTREIYWQHPLAPDYDMSILPPVKNGNLLFASGETTASAVFQLASDKPDANVLWRGRQRSSIHNATSSVVFDGDHIYGADLSEGALICIDASSGQRVWKSTVATTGKDQPKGPNHASAFLLKIDSRYLIFSETGHVISAELSPEGYKETGRFQAIEPTEEIWRRQVVWTYPAVADKRLFLRNDKQIVCYSLAAE